MCLLSGSNLNPADRCISLTLNTQTLQVRRGLGFAPMEANGVGIHGMIQEAFPRLTYLSVTWEHAVVDHVTALSNLLCALPHLLYFSYYNFYLHEQEGFAARVFQTHRLPLKEMKLHVLNAVDCTAMFSSLSTACPDLEVLHIGTPSLLQDGLTSSAPSSSSSSSSSAQQAEEEFLVRTVCDSLPHSLRLTSLLTLLCVLVELTESQFAITRNCESTQVGGARSLTTRRLAARVSRILARVAGKTT
jgi:hypothetical protein